MADAIERERLAGLRAFFTEQGLVGGHGEGVHDVAEEGMELALLGPLTEVAVAERGSGEDMLRLAAE